MDLLHENERLDDLGYNGLQIIQNKKWFCFGMDAVLLSHFASDIHKHKKVMDLCAGNGIISFLLSQKIQPFSITAIEIQKDIADLFQRSIQYNHLENIIQLHCMDLKQVDTVFPLHSFDAVVTNPPYMKNNAGLKNEEEHKWIARHEITCQLEDVIKAASLMLKSAGSFYLVHRPDRLCDIFYCLRQYQLEPKSIRFVQPTMEKPANLVLIKACKDAKPFLKMQPNLVIYQPNGSYTDEVLSLYQNNSL